MTVISTVWQKGFVIMTNLVKLKDEEVGGLQRKLDEIKRRISDGTLGFHFAMDGLQQIVEGGNDGAHDYYDGSMPVISIWRTITLGLFSNIDAYLESFRHNGIPDVGPDAAKVIQKVQVSEQLKHLDLVRLNGRELGFPNGATRPRIYSRAKALGLELCPQEVGLSLRLHYKEQPTRETLEIAMEPFKMHRHGEYVFELCIRPEGPDLGGGASHSRFPWPPSIYWVFVKP